MNYPTTEQVFRLSQTILGKYGVVIGVTVFCLYIAVITAVSWIVPATNWDMVAYIASILDLGDLTSAEIHKQSWAAVREHVSEGQFIVLTSDRPYRVRQFADPEAFYSMLGFYRAKYLYIQLAALVAPLTGPLAALRILTTISIAGIGLITLYWFSRQRILIMAPLAVALFILSGFGNMALLVAPDLLASMFIILAALFFINKNGPGLVVALLLAILTRPDHLVFIGILAFVSLATGTMRRASFIAFLLSTGSYFLVAYASGHPGWWVQMWFTHIEYVPTLVGFHPDFSVIAYIKIAVSALARSMINNTWLAVLFLEAFFLAVLANLKYKITREESTILIAIFATFAVKFVVFPLYETRFHFAYLVVCGLVLISIFGRSFQHKNKTRIA